MSAHHNSPEAEGSHDPAGSTQMFRAFVAEGEDQAARTPSVPGSRRRPKESGGLSGGRIGLALALVLVLGAALWVVLH
ncbi:hypothetical protein WDV06_31385 [Streptomyces racemochromogenes]|uniref:Uncharacterized protein n=1 Tax=Streptomyces racemochromogenes TaxID=67353 RepID=A0ABW7PMC5_9ACTN